MSATSFFAKIPWEKIKRYVPIIIEAAKVIYDEWKERAGNEDNSSHSRKSTQISIRALEDRVARLESNELQQAELLSTIAKQLEDLTTALEISSKRATFALVASASAFVVVFTLLIFAIAGR